MTEKQTQITQTPDNYQSMDAGSRSLSNALRIVFGVLKIVMAALVLIFIFSGFFVVGPDERAVVLRLGKIRTDAAGQAVLEPGFHLAWPYPIDEVIKFPGQNTVESLSVDSFWYYMTDEEKVKGVSGSYVPETLDPTKDGYCLTRNESVIDFEGTDYNISHSKWQLTYRIADPVMFLQNVYVPPPQPGENYSAVIPRGIEPFLRSVVEDAVIGTMVNYSIDQAIRSYEKISSDVQVRLQQKLDILQSGIQIDIVKMVDSVWPRQANDAFVRSIKAKQEADKEITEARAYAAGILNETAGPAAEELAAALKDDSISMEKLESIWSNTAGEVRRIMSEAAAYKTGVLEQARSEAEYLQKLLPEYQKRPELVIQRIYQDMIEQVLGEVDEKIIVQPAEGHNTEFRILINRDPAAAKSK